MSLVEKRNEFFSLFAPEPQPDKKLRSHSQSAWKVLLVDDEQDVHALFSLALQDIVVEDLPLQVFYAYTAEEAKTILNEHRDICLVLIDVVMETEQAGLQLVDYIRQDLDNQQTQIALVTGQPAYAPRRAVVVDYAINCYWLKSELTADKIFVCVYTAIRTYSSISKQVEQQRLNSETKPLEDEIYNQAEIGRWELTSDKRLLRWSRQTAKILGFDSGIEPSNEILKEVIHSEDVASYFQAIEQAFSSGEEMHVQYRIKRYNDKEERWLETKAKLVKNSRGESEKLAGLIKDITECKRIPKEIERLSRVFKQAQEGMVITDSDGVIIEVNASFSRVTGFAADECIGQSSNILNSGRQNKEFYAAMWKELIELGHWRGELWNKRKNGEIYAELLSISSLKNAKGDSQYFVGLFFDITDRKYREKSIEDLAFYDELTFLPNRTLFADRFNQAIAHSKRNNRLLAVCFLDLDNFKFINDNYGHDAGDQLLIKVADRISSTVRNEDTVSRFGGDEFALLLGDLESYEQCDQFLSRLITILAEPYRLDNQTVTISASCGVTFFPLDGDDYQVLLKHADQAMYQAKGLGKNRHQLYEANT